ncbi:MAG: hypothetical protein JXA42_18790 [Anaerolineales bacterium]|nr:hypothetical protein [Anaerolineales bacterium]
MMRKGKVFKIRMGHEANCSTGFVFIMALMASGMTLLPASVIISAIHVAILGGGKRPAHRWLYWFIPILVGAICTVLIANFNNNSEFNDSELTPVIFGIGSLFLFTTVFSYFKAPNLTRPKLLMLMSPAILVIGFCLILLVLFLAA